MDARLPAADIWIYSSASSPLPEPAGYGGPDGYFECLEMVQPEGNHGDAFHYKTINTDALGWIISRVSGMEVTEQLSDHIWSKMGAEQNACMTVDAKGTPFAGGGLSAGLRARTGDQEPGTVYLSRLSEVLQRAIALDK